MHQRYIIIYAKSRRKMISKSEGANEDPLSNGKTPVPGKVRKTQYTLGSTIPLQGSKTACTWQSMKAGKSSGKSKIPINWVLDSSPFKHLEPFIVAFLGHMMMEEANQGDWCFWEGLLYIRHAASKRLLWNASQKQTSCSVTLVSRRWA